VDIYRSTDPASLAPGDLRLIEGMAFDLALSWPSVVLWQQVAETIPNCWLQSMVIQHTHRIHVWYIYMLTWMGYIDGIHVTIYSSTMDPSWVDIHPAFPSAPSQISGIPRNLLLDLVSSHRSLVRPALVRVLGPPRAWSKRRQNIYVPGISQWNVTGEENPGNF